MQPDFHHGLLAGSGAAPSDLRPPTSDIHLYLITSVRSLSHAHHEGDASQSMPVSPPMGAPGGASKVDGILEASIGRSRNRLTSAPISPAATRSSRDELFPKASTAP